MKRRGTDADTIDLEEIEGYLEANSTKGGVEAEVNTWRRDLVQFVLNRLQDPKD